MYPRVAVLLVIQLVLANCVISSPNCSPVKTPRTVKKYVNDHELDFFFKIAKEITNRQKTVQDTLIKAEVYDQTAMADHFSNQHIPERVAFELLDQQNLETTKHLLDVHFHQPPHEWFKYEHSQIFNCSESLDRLYDETEACDFRGVHKCRYATAGLCTNEYYFEDGPAFTHYRYLFGEKNPVLERERSKCKLPSPRVVAEAIRKFFFKPNITVPNTAKIPSLLTLTTFQFIAHDSMNFIMRGNHKGGHGPSSVSYDMTSKHPALISTHYTADIPVPCNDSFYSQYKVTSLPFVRAANVQPTCQIGLGGPVSWWAGGKIKNKLFI